jgi:hypothetical protein
MVNGLQRKTARYVVDGICATRDSRSEDGRRDVESIFGSNLDARQNMISRSQRRLGASPGEIRGVSLRVGKFPTQVIKERGLQTKNVRNQAEKKRGVSQRRVEK